MTLAWRIGDGRRGRCGFSRRWYPVSRCVRECGAAARRQRRGPPRQKLCASAGAGLHCATQPRPIRARPGTQWDRARPACGCPARPARTRVRRPPARLASLVSPWKTPAVPPVRARAGCFWGYPAVLCTAVPEW